MAHAQHRLNGQIVKVLGQAGDHWLVVGTDGEVQSIPRAWLEEIIPIIPSTDPIQPWAGVTELLNLVTMMERLHSQPPDNNDAESFLIVSASAPEPPEEVDDDCQSRDNLPNQLSAGDTTPGGEPHPTLGANSPGQAPGTDPGAGRHADPQTPVAGNGKSA